MASELPADPPIKRLFLGGVRSPLNLARPPWDLLTQAPDEREPLQASFSDAANPLGLDGVEFIEYATPKPQALGQLLRTIGMR